MTNNDRLTLVMTGPLEIWDQEGGYASPKISIGGDDLGGTLEELIESKNLTMDHGHQGRLEGYWILALTRVAKTPPVWATESAEKAVVQGLSGDSTVKPELFHGEHLQGADSKGEKDSI